ncbi:MAG: DUF4129 domain-containing protein, partial [Candidatus Limnocylindria bacterium]
AAVPASADTVGRDEYRERLEEARALLAEALRAEPAGREATVERARRALRQTTAVRLEDGATVAVDDGPVASRLTTADDSIRAALADVTVLLDLASRRPAVDTAAAVAQLRQRVGEHRASDAQMTFIDLFSQWLARFLADLRGAPPDPRILLTAAGGLGLALVLVVLGILGRDLRERFRREVMLPELRPEGRPDPAAHLRRAEEALRAGSAREAIHALYLYAIAALASREAIRYDPSLTDRELLARAGSIPNAQALRDLVEIHDRVWYGLRDAGAAEASRARQLARRAAA